MEELKIHSEGARQHLKALEEAFKAVRNNLKTRTDLTKTEKEAQLMKAKNVFLNEKRDVKKKLF